jgi:hypothetical protein
MKKYLFIILLVGVWSCEDKSESAPTVTITSAFPNSVSEIINITVMANDDNGIEKVELWVNGINTEVFDSSEPYLLELNTVPFNNGSVNIIVIRAYDVDGNTTDSEPINIVVDNGPANPSICEISSISYSFTEMSVGWVKSNDDDFFNYKLLMSSSYGGEKDTIHTIYDKNINSYSISDFDPTVENWFWIITTDIYGLQSISSGMTNEIEYPPQISEISSIEYLDGNFIIEWDPVNDSIDNDFISYELFESNFENMSQSNLIFSTNDKNIINYQLPVDEGIFKYYKLTVTDFWGLASESQIKVGDSHDWFVKVFNSLEGEGRAVIEIDNGYMIAGRYFDNAEEKLFLLKTDTRGNVIFEKFFSNNTKASSIIPMLDGGFLITGSSSIANSHGILHLKIDSEGNEIWSSINGHNPLNTYYYYLNNSFEDEFGNIFSISASEDYYDYSVMKLDQFGNLIWIKDYGDDNYIETATKIIKHDNNSFSVLYNKKPNGGGGDVPYISKFDYDGNLLSYQNYGESVNANMATSMFKTSAGDLIIVGSSSQYNAFVTKIDESGNEVWAYNHTLPGMTSGFEGWLYPLDVTEIQNGGYIITGRYSGWYRLFMLKIDSNGSLEWSKVLNEFSFANSVKEVEGGKLIFTGGFYPNQNTNERAVLIKTDEFGNMPSFPDF